MNSISPLIFCAFLIQIFLMRLKSVEGSPRRIVSELDHLETFTNHKNFNPDAALFAFSLKSENAETDEEETENQSDSGNGNGNGNDNKDNKTKKDKSKIEEEDVINFQDPESIDTSSMGDSNSSGGDKNDWSKKHMNNGSSNNYYSKSKSKTKKNSQEEEDIMKDFHKSKTTAKPHSINSHGKGNSNHKKTSHSANTKTKQTEQQQQQGQDEDLKSIMDKAIEKATSISENIGDAIKAAMNSVATALKNATEVSEIVASVPCNLTSKGSISTTPLNLKVNFENCTYTEEQNDKSGNTNSKTNSNSGPVSSVNNMNKKQWRYSEVAKWPPVLPFEQIPQDTLSLLSSSNTGTTTKSATASKKRDQNIPEIPDEFSGVLSKGKVGSDGPMESEDKDEDSSMTNSNLKSGSESNKTAIRVQIQVEDPDESEEDAENIMINATNSEMTSSSKAMPLIGNNRQSVPNDHHSAEEEDEGETGSGESSTRITSGTKSSTSSTETMDDNSNRSASRTKVTQVQNQNQTSSSGPAPKSAVQRDVSLTISGGGGMHTSGLGYPSGTFGGSSGSSSIISASTSSGDYPIMNKPGTCRLLTSEVSCIALSQGSSQCKTDNGCPGTKKCCFYGCAPYNSVGICEFPTMHI